MGVVIYEDNMLVASDDILIVLTCLPLVPYFILERFNKVVYYFDDINYWKAMEPKYSKNLSRVDVIAHPVRTVSDHLNKTGIKHSFYVPWSISRLPGNVIQKSTVPSFYVDIDSRQAYLASIERAVDFIKSVIRINAEIFVPAKYEECLPECLRSKCKFVQHLPHAEFMNLMSSIWYYVSGIAGSYEYTVLESCFLGCGAISLGGALIKEHEDRKSFHNFLTSDVFLNDLNKDISEFNPEAIREDAFRKYPQDGVLYFRQIFSDFRWA